MKPLGCHHLNVFSRTCSYPPVLLLKESFLSTWPLVEKIKLIGSICVYFEKPRVASPHQVSSLASFPAVWVCMNLMFLSSFLFSAQKKRYPGYLLEDWVVTSFTARRTKLVFWGLTLSMGRLCQGAARGGCSAESWAGSQDVRTMSLPAQTQLLSAWAGMAEMLIMSWWYLGLLSSAITATQIQSFESGPQNCDTELFSPADHRIHWPEEEAEQV